MALMLLTRLPAGTLVEPPPQVKACVWAFPVAGLLVGGAGAFIGVASASAGLPPLMAAILVVAAQIMLTGGLHEDGLADTADGLGGGRDKDHALAIMRDSRLGTYGTLALLLSVLLRVAGIVAILEAGFILLVLPVLAAASRVTMGLALALLPPARPDGLGFHAAAGEAYGGVFSAVALGCLSLLVLGPVVALPVIGAMLLAAGVVSWLAIRKIGGQTGDILGTVQQTSELAGLVVICALLAKP